MTRRISWVAYSRAQSRITAFHNAIDLFTRQPYLTAMGRLEGLIHENEIVIAQYRKQRADEIANRDNAEYHKQVADMETGDDE